MAITEVRLVTSNPNKLTDIRAILSTAGISIQGVAVDLVEIQGTIEEISIAKCRAAAEMVGGPVMIDDTALCFTAMNGLPGPYIKPFLSALGAESLHLMLAGFSDKSAKAIATVAYCQGPGHEPILFPGQIEGVIVPARGKIEYGWQACFEYADSGMSLAEMEDGEKHEISHLGKALQKFTAWCREIPSVGHGSAQGTNENQE